MKRVLCLFMSALLMCCQLVGCGKTQPETPETTESAKSNALFEENPADDGVLRILMIGMLKEAGIQADVCNLYYSGCSLKQHINFRQDGSSPYVYYVKETSGQPKEYEQFTIDSALEDRNWDIVTLQQAFWPEMTENLAEARAVTTPYAKELFDYIRELLPQAKLMWHQTWAYQVGFDWRAGRDPQMISESMKVLTVEKQTAFYEVIRNVSDQVCQENNVPYIPVSDAWQIARQHPDIGDVLCDKPMGAGDNLHDGDVGGGQYLNACVWFEFITGQSCIGNSFRPSYYVLSEEMIHALQSCAHKAVDNLANR